MLKSALVLLYALSVQGVDIEQVPIKLIPDEQKALSYNGLAMTPQMGWNNWATFKCDVSADLLSGTAQRIVDLGLKDVGYNYVVLDDCWSMGRDEQTKELMPSKIKFPKGMKDMADRIHSLGLLFGMYSSAGAWTCAGYEGSLGFEDIDAKTFAKWDVDYLKYDNCFNQGQSGTPEISFNRYKAMSDALLNSGRKILYSMCNWGDDSPWDWAPTIANSWRMSGDLYDSYNKPDMRCPCSGDEYYCKLPGFHCSFMNVLNKAAAMISKARPGGWNDLDMMEIGNGGSTDEEYKTHFSMWSALKSPLLIAADVRKLNAQAYSIYTNQAVIAVNQDPLGMSAHRVWRYFVDDKDEYGQGEISLWTGPLSEGDQVVALLNGGNNSRTMNASLAQIFADFGQGGSAKQIQYKWDVYDLWANRMDNEVASQIVDNSSKDLQVQALTSQHLFNVTETSYAEGLALNDPRLLGKKTGTVEAGGTIYVEVPRHGVALYRLRKTQEKSAAGTKQDL